MSKAKKATLELDSMIDEINTTANKNKDTVELPVTVNDKPVAAVDEIIFPVDSEGKMILTSLLGADGKTYIPEENEQLPFVYLGRPTTLRLLSKEEVDKLIDAHHRIFYHLNGKRKIWKVVSKNACQIYVDSKSTLITHLGWGQEEGVTVGYHGKDNFCPTMLLQESTVQVDELVMLGTTGLFKTRIFGSRFYTRGFESIETYLRGEHLDIENTEFRETTIEGSFSAKDSYFYDATFRFSEGKSEVSNFNHARIDQTEISLSGKDRLDVIDFTIRNFKYARRYSFNTPGYHFKISLRVHYGHFSGIYDLPFISTADGRVMVRTTIFDINEFTQSVSGGLRRISRKCYDGGDRYLSSSDRNEAEERNLIVLHEKLTKILFGDQTGPIGDSDHVGELLGSLANQISSRLRLLQTLKVLSVTETQYLD